MIEIPIWAFVCLLITTGISIGFLAAIYINAYAGERF
jgi:ABC-type phosphate transport system permease subunit